MARYGSDKPDTRFGLELVDLTDLAKDSGFKVFSGTAENGGGRQSHQWQGCAQGVAPPSIISSR